MRMIKFRGVRIDNGEFVFGDLLQQPTCRIVNADGEFEIKPESVAQFVGYGIDNCELYEGDHAMLMNYYSGISASYYKDKAREYGLKMPPDFSDLSLQYYANDFAILAPHIYDTKHNMYDASIGQYRLVTPQEHERLMKEQSAWRSWIDESIRKLEHKT